MKTTNPVRSLTTLTLLAVGLAFWPANAADTIEFQRVDKIDKIWLAEGFAFKDYGVPLAIFEMDEKGDWMGGGFTSNESLQEKASSELGKDLGRFIEKVRNGEKIKYKKVKKD